MESQPRTLFISYCRRDSEFAHRLAADLKANGGAVWFDQADIRPGEAWDAAVQAALESCTSLIVVLSPDSVGSQNVRDEVNFAIKKKKEILPILYRDCEMPFRLDRLQRLDFRGSYEQGFVTLRTVLKLGSELSSDNSGLLKTNVLLNLTRSLRRRFTTFSPRSRRRAAAALLLLAVAVPLGDYLVLRMRPCLPRGQALHPFNDGVRAIRDGSYVRATINLQEAVKQDPRNPMVHARLAEAWYNLDFLGDARREALAALTAEHCFSAIDATRMKAIQETITADYPDAIRDYTSVLDHLSGDEASDANVELGQVYQASGDITHALESYQQAGKLDPHNPAAFLHIGILQSRMHHVNNAKAAFDDAQKQIERNKDDELTSELNFQLGYAIFDAGDELDNAKKFLNMALKGAEKQEHLQLRIRILTTLSGVEYHAGDYTNAFVHAKQAIQLATPDLKPWAAMGYVRVANVYILESKLGEAKEQIASAQELLRDNSQPRAQAAADFTLASIEAQEGNPAQSLIHANTAYAYYSTNGFAADAIDARVLIIQADTSLGNYAEAFHHLTGVLSEAQSLGSRAYQGEVRETAGNFYEQVEDFPKALENYYVAEKLNAGNQIWDAIQCAVMFSKLGQFSQADSMLTLVPAGSAYEYNASVARVQMLLAQKMYKPALNLIAGLSGKFPQHVNDDLSGIGQLKAIAEAHLKFRQQALADLTRSTAPQNGDTPDTLHQNELIAAEVYFALGMDRDALNSATNAANYFQPGNTQHFPRYESSLRSVGLAVAASGALQDTASYTAWSKKCVDIQNILMRHWESESYRQFLSRPDIQDLLVPYPTVQ